MYSPTFVMYPINLRVLLKSNRTLPSNSHVYYCIPKT